MTSRRAARVPRGGAPRKCRAPARWRSPPASAPCTCRPRHPAHPRAAPRQSPRQRAAARAATRCSACRAPRRERPPMGPRRRRPVRPPRVRRAPRAATRHTASRSAIWVSLLFSTTALLPRLARRQLSSMPTLFTKIINGDIPCCEVARGETWLAFLDINPRREGHTLVVPYEAKQRLADLSSHQISELFQGVVEAQLRLSNYFGTTDFSIGIHDGPIAGQEVPHVCLLYTSDAADE